MKLPVAIVVLTLLTQSSKVTPRDLLSDPRPLSNAEIAEVLVASQQAMAGKTFRLSFNGPGQGRGTEILMGRNGMPRRIRSAGAIVGGVVGGLVPGAAEPDRVSATWRLDYVTLTDYTGRPARHCNGTPDQGDLVVEYRLESSSVSWNVTARRREARDFGGLGLAPLFQMLQGAGSFTSGELGEIDRHSARALISAWTPTTRSSQEPPALIGDPTPNVRGEPVQSVLDEAVQRLWIDTRTLLPVRWRVSERGRTGVDLGFNYAPIDLRLPKGVHARDCVQ
jgi:hypothetical protein